MGLLLQRKIFRISFTAQSVSLFVIHYLNFLYNIVNIVASAQIPIELGISTNYSAIIADQAGRKCGANCAKDILSSSSSSVRSSEDNIKSTSKPLCLRHILL